MAASASKFKGLREIMYHFLCIQDLVNLDTINTHKKEFAFVDSACFIASIYLIWPILGS